MPPASAERWFHALVVVGAALGGCGGRAVEKGEPMPMNVGGAASSNGTGMAGIGHAGSGGASSTAPASPDACEFDGAFVCDDYQKGSGCHCDSTRPRDASACQSPLDFVCTELRCTPPPNGLCSTPRNVGCACDSTTPKPEDCESPELFFCQELMPVFRNCGCQPGPAVDPTSCQFGYNCQSDNPRFGCGCCCTPIK